MELDIYVVDAFTSQQFCGNSAAVVPVEEWLDESLMQSIAAENNLSETAFIKAISENHYHIRWFSPLTEIDFCGHATLAASYVLFNQIGVSGVLRYSTGEVGDLEVKMTSDGQIEMSFPNQMPKELPVVPQALLQGLSIQPIQILKNRQAYFAVLPSAQDVLNVKYESEKLKQLAPFDVVVTAASEQYDFVSRYFWPANGGDEDPVTGSIHSGLAPYWAKQFNRTHLVAYQASQRGGLLHCCVEGERVMVSGRGVLYLKGRLFV
ncbi:PhzF family phenazine biosynthesis protein [Vibrio agarivorans]|uniref:PhzF family phenazine biosynthesis protein n=1 Tax=Vibrio agarivorans TaxID=153622 RepID=UPI0025B5C621|nr:PhzF family phenazine biosynthesis protein [Vibrio agarivorans]MDN3660868.1 PhzF family phenazine biosynthesis protein [Vibrio agarivorans]